MNETDMIQARSIAVSSLVYSRYTAHSRSESIIEKNLGLEQQDPRGARGPSDYGKLSTMDASIEYLKSHRYQTVFGAWAA